MNTLGTLSMWLNTISSEVDELAVSKHTSQVSNGYGYGYGDSYGGGMAERKRE